MRRWWAVLDRAEVLTGAGKKDAVSRRGPEPSENTKTIEDLAASECGEDADGVPRFDRDSFKA
jgi:hypothetical protein